MASASDFHKISEAETAAGDERDTIATARRLATSGAEDTEAP
jgi:hypothetical protein